MAEKGGEIPRVSTVQSQLDARIREVISKRGEEPCVAIRKHEEEVATAMARGEDNIATAMARGEDNILSAVRQRERGEFDAWRVREERIQAEAGAIFVERMQWIAAKEVDLEAQQNRSPESCPRVQMTEEPGHGRDKRIASTYSNITTLVNRNTFRPVQDIMPFAMKGLPHEDRPGSHVPRPNSRTCS